MNAKHNGYKIEPGRIEELRAAALQARGEYIAGLLIRGGQALHRGGRRLAGLFRPAPKGRQGQSYYRCPDCA